MIPDFTISERDQVALAARTAYSYFRIDLLDREAVRSYSPLYMLEKAMRGLDLASQAGVLAGALALRIVLLNSVTQDARFKLDADYRAYVLLLAKVRHCMTARTTTEEHSILLTTSSQDLFIQVPMTRTAYSNYRYKGLESAYYKNASPLTRTMLFLVERLIDRGYPFVVTKNDLTAAVQQWQVVETEETTKREATQAKEEQYKNAFGGGVFMGNIPPPNDEVHPLNLFIPPPDYFDDDDD